MKQAFVLLVLVIIPGAERLSLSLQEAVTSGH